MQIYLKQRVMLCTLAMEMEPGYVDYHSLDQLHPQSSILEPDTVKHAANMSFQS